MDLTGSPAPAFSTLDADGRLWTLADLAGARTLIYFYPRDSTPGCTQESCAFRDLLPDFSALGVRVLGVSPDSPASHKRFAAAQQLSFPLLCDQERLMLTAYHAWGTKMMYGKEVEGVIRSTVLIDETGKVIRHWRPVKGAAEHPAACLEHLRAL